MKIYSKKMMGSKKEKETNNSVIQGKDKRKESLLERKKNIRNMKSLTRKKFKNKNNSK